MLQQPGTISLVKGWALPEVGCSVCVCVCVPRLAIGLTIFITSQEADTYCSMKHLAKQGPDASVLFFLANS